MTAIQLDERQRLHLLEHQTDVGAIRDVLHRAGVEATREEAYLLWAEHSERSAAGWLVVDRDEIGDASVMAAHGAFADGRKGRDEESARSIVVPAVAVPNREAGARETAEAVASMRAVGFSPPEKPPRDAATLARMNRIAGHLSNVAYMANAIDEMDGVPPAMRATSVPGGTKQLHSMMADRRPGMDEIARCYVALRRAQRSGDDARLRTGLVVMVAAQAREVGHADVLASLGDDGRALATQVARSGAKGGPDRTEATTPPARTADRGR